MRVFIKINQAQAVEWGMDAKEAMVFGFLYEHHFDSEKVFIDGIEWSNVPKEKVVSEVPILGVGKGSIYRLMKEIEKKGLMFMHGDRALGMTLIRFPDEAKMWIPFT